MNEFYRKVEDMPKASLTRAEWDEIREFVERTGDIPAAAAKFGVKANSVHQRAHRENWVTQKRLAESSLVEEARRIAKTLTHDQAVKVISHDSAQIMGAAAARMAKLREDVPMEVSEKVAEKIRQGLTELGVPKSWKEFATAIGVFSQMTGLNKSTALSISVSPMSWGSAPSPASPIVLQVDPLSVDQANQ